MGTSLIPRRVELVRKPVAKPGFSLMEMVVVVSLLSIFAAGSMLILSGSLSQSRSVANVRAVLGLHRHAIRESRGNEVFVIVDVSRQAFQLQVNGSVIEVIELPESLQLFRVVRGRTDAESSSQTIGYHDGGSETYAFLMGTPHGRKKWYVIGGATGSVEVIDNEESTESRLSQWLARWSNAD